jgi:hypothetical protein
MTPATIPDAGRIVVSFPSLQMLQRHNSPTTAPLSSGNVFLRSGVSVDCAITSVSVTARCSLVGGQLWLPLKSAGCNQVKSQSQGAVPLLTQQPVVKKAFTCGDFPAFNCICPHLTLNWLLSVKPWKSNNSLPLNVLDWPFVFDVNISGDEIHIGCTLLALRYLRFGKLELGEKLPAISFNHVALQSN